MDKGLFHSDPVHIGNGLCVPMKPFREIRSADSGGIKLNLLKKSESHNRKYYTTWMEYLCDL